MADSKKFSQGDLVLHPRRLEWGDGVIEQASTIYHQGRPAQRVVVSFANHGRVTINTAVAPLLPKDAMGIATHVSRDAESSEGVKGSRPTATAAAGRSRGWLAQLEQPQAGPDELWHLPDSLTDPFLSLAKRLEATLETYRFTADQRNPGLLLDWAVIQTGLNDPLTKYTRHDLEQAFPRFARDRDQHLLQLARLAKSQGKFDILEQALRNAKLPAARDALHRAMRH
jgi:hypothetical protein